MLNLSSIFSGLLNNAEGILDKVVTTDKEKKQLRNQLEQIFINAEANAQKEVTDRWKADMNSDNYLSKNIRPLTLIFLTVIFVLISFCEGNIGRFTIDAAYKPIYQTLLITVYGAYFAGRSIEKVKKK